MLLLYAWVTCSCAASASGASTFPVGWGFAIVNFVWWIGIGHAGTLISAILLLLRQPWRNSINRFAEAMTLFAVACAGMFPVLHLGRPWLVYWLFPYPNTMDYWPQFRSPLVWDVFAVSTYFTISLVFWFIGLIPDLATLRDRAANRWAAIIYGILAMGWRGSARHWTAMRRRICCSPGLATPLVLSVHTVVSFDFAISIVPGWHTTIFPPYFVAGAIYSGFAMVLMLAIPIRKIYGLEDFITQRHLDNSAKVMLATGLDRGLRLRHGSLHGLVQRQYVTTHSLLWNRLHGPYAHVYWSLLTCNIFLPQVLWIREGPHQPSAVVHGFAHRPDRDVAGAVRHCRGQLAARLPAFFLGHVLPDALGLDDVYRNARVVPGCHVPVPAHPAHDLDL